MSERQLGDDYDAWHERMQRGDHGTPLSLPWYRSVFPHIKQQARGRLLEIGCGRGDFAIWLAAELPHLEITAVDFSARAIEIAKERAAERGIRVSFFQGDAQALNFPNNEFDYVVSCECMEHVEYPRRMSDEIFRVLKPGGQFCLTTENYLNGMLIGWLKTWLTGEKFNSGSGVQPRENFFFFWHVREYLQRAGLIVDQTESCHYQWLLLPRVDPAKLCTKNFSSDWARKLAKPFGRHFSFFGFKPSP